MTEIPLAEEVRQVRAELDRAVLSGARLKQVRATRHALIAVGPVPDLQELPGNDLLREILTADPELERRCGPLSNDVAQRIRQCEVLEEILTPASRDSERLTHTLHHLLERQGDHLKKPEWYDTALELLDLELKRRAIAAELGPIVQREAQLGPAIKATDQINSILQTHLTRLRAGVPNADMVARHLATQLAHSACTLGQSFGEHYPKVNAPGVKQDTLAEVERMHHELAQLRDSLSREHQVIQEQITHLETQLRPLVEQLTAQKG